MVAVYCWTVDMAEYGTLAEAHLPDWSFESSDSSLNWVDPLKAGHFASDVFNLKMPRAMKENSIKAGTLLCVQLY